MEAKVTHVECKFMKHMLLHEAWDNLILLLEPTHTRIPLPFTFSLCTFPLKNIYYVIPFKRLYLFIYVKPEFSSRQSN